MPPHWACLLNCILGQTFQQSMCALCISALTGAWLTSGRGFPETLDLEPASLKLHTSFQISVSINDQGPLAFENLMNENFEPMASSNRDTEANVGLLYILFAAMVVVAVFSFLWVGGHILIFLLFKNRLKTWW